MSKKPYIVQEGSPNLVIVPTDNVETFYDQSPMKMKESGAPLESTPSPSYTAVFASKTGAKRNCSSVNNDVLIDVRKVQRSPSSWATNYLQSIGGPSAKIDRIYSLAPKSSTLLKNSATRPDNNKESTLTHSTNQKCHTNTNITSQIMEKSTPQPKININLIKPKSAPEPTMTKEASKPKYITHSYTSTSTNLRPSLPKNYKIPMQSKKPQMNLVTDKQIALPINSITSKNHTLISPYKNKDEIVDPNHNNTAIPNITINKDIDLNKSKDPNQLQLDSNSSQQTNHPEKTPLKSHKNAEHIKHSNEEKHLKTTKVKYHIPAKREKTPQPVNNKENNQPKHNKETIHRKPDSEIALRKNHNDHCQQRNTNSKPHADIIAHIKSIKEKYKLKNKQEPSYSTKLKTKKEHISVASSNVSKRAKRSKSKDNQTKETRSKKYKDTPVTNNGTRVTQSRLTKDDIIVKHKKRALENTSSQCENSNSKAKKIRLSPPDTIVKTKISKTVTEERLSKSISPIKSVVSIIKPDQPLLNSETFYHKKSGYYHSHHDKTATKNKDYHCQNSEKYVQRGLNVDLRTKLKRKNPKNDYRKDKLSYANKKDKFVTVPNGDRFVPDENLIISFNAENDSEETIKMKKSPVKKLARKQSTPKDKKCKKIKLEINIVFGHGDTTDEESAKSEAESNNETIENMDLSFLDDFNVDEIAESLLECKDSTKKSNAMEEKDADSSVRRGLSGDNLMTRTIDDKHSMLLKTRENICKDISSSKLLNCQETSLKTAVPKHRTSQEELQYTNSMIGTEVVNKDENNGIEYEIKSELSQNNNSLDTNVKVSTSEEPVSNTTNTSTNHNTTNIVTNKVQESAMTENKNHITQFNNNCQDNKRTHDDNNLQFQTKMEHTETNENNKEHVIASEEPAVMSRTESNIYSDHNDIIDALQDNCNLEINAIKSYIASLNNNMNEQPKSKQVVATSTHYTTSILTCIKEDPDVILIDDSDSENETEMKSLPYISGDVTIVKPTGTNSEPIVILDTNDKPSQPAQESLLNNSDKVIINEPAGENNEPILILDENTETLQLATEIMIDGQSDEVTIVEPAGENSEPILLLDGNIETSQPAVDLLLDKSEVTTIEHSGNDSKPILRLDRNAETSRNDKSDKVTTIGPAGENSEPLLILNENSETAKPDKDSLLVTTDEVTIESAGEKSDSILILGRNTESPLDQSDTATISESAGENSESTLILETSAEDLQPTEESHLDKLGEAMIVEPTSENFESVLDTDYGIGKTDKTSQLNERSQNADRKNKISLEKAKITPITTTTTAKTALETNSIENTTSTSTGIDSSLKVTKETLVEIPKTDNKTNNKSDNLPNAAKVACKTEQKPPDESSSKNTNSKEVSTVKCSPKTVPVNTKTQNINTKRDSKPQNKGNSETHKESKEKVSKHSEIDVVERSAALANNKFVLAMEAKLAPFMGQKCTVTDIIRHHGRFSKIYRCKDGHNQDYAIKTLKKQFDGFNIGLLKQNMMLELQNGVPEDNLNCVRYITGFITSGQWCFLMEYFPMNLQQALNENRRSFHIDDVQILSRQLVSAVTILRNNNIIHSDIKPSHILINSSQTRIKLCGFDQAAYFEDIKLLPNTGTLNYRAPELILGYPAGYEIDVWSTALVMYEMATNRRLFPGVYNNNILYQQLCTLGAIPIGMLMESKFRNAHFRGTAFIKIYGKNESMILTEMEFNDRLHTTLFQAYTTDWGNKRQANKREDKAKIHAFFKLLHSMLVMHPKCRIAIEFVFADPFIYECFDRR